ncbi:MAG: hypothetical protein WD048_04215 [Chitinophagales bacterium]
MKRVVLNIKNSEFKFFMNLIEKLNFVQIEDIEGDTKADVIKNVEQGFKEMKLYNENKLKTTPAKDFLDEL